MSKSYGKVTISHQPEQVLQDCLSVLPSSCSLQTWSPCASLLDLFIIQETTFVIFALFTKLKLKKLVLTFTTHAHTKIINQPLPNGFGKPQNNNKKFSLSMECNIQSWKTFLFLDATRMVNLDIMHNLILQILKDHTTFKLFIPESKSKIHFRSHTKSNDTNSSDSESITSNSSLDKITFTEARSLRKDTAKIINESLPTTLTQKNYLPMPTPHTKHPSSGSVEIPSFDADYIPTSEIPSELDISALSDHQIKGEALEQL
ncbi:hypothetical protein O181_092654 [Austropuccinia psidii MF-1]|uniref:Uncharacterized protein n=1 Tax=Austropuccinia psidii MF-1 TaxID=1389203 RepID=A0A9Q3IZW7_9BASI|nr:hypothetical protein [Austropuccinia psidii MF-1]